MPAHRRCHGRPLPRRRTSVRRELDSRVTLGTRLHDSAPRARPRSSVRALPTCGWRLVLESCDAPRGRNRGAQSKSAFGRGWAACRGGVLAWGPRSEGREAGAVLAGRPRRPQEDWKRNLLGPGCGPAPSASGRLGPTSYCSVPPAAAPCPEVAGLPPPHPGQMSTSLRERTSATRVPAGKACLWPSSSASSSPLAPVHDRALGQ